MFFKYIVKQCVVGSCRPNLGDTLLKSQLPRVAVVYDFHGTVLKISQFYGKMVSSVRQLLLLSLSVTVSLKEMKTGGFCDKKNKKQTLYYNFRNYYVLTDGQKKDRNLLKI